MKTMITRRNFLQQTAFIATLPTINSFASAVLPPKIEFFTSSSICPLCSIGCKIELNKALIQDEMTVLGLKGDNTSQINNGELCQKISNLPFKNESTKTARIKTPLLKLKNNKYDKNGILTPISWKNAFDIMELRSRKAFNDNGVNGVGLILSDRLSLYESYAMMKLYKGGFRTNNISNINFETQTASLANIQNFGIEGSNGSVEDIFNSDVLVSFGIDFNVDLKIIHNKIKKQKELQNDNFLFINICADKNHQISDADINLLIKPKCENILMNYLINKSLLSLTKEELDKVRSETIFAHINPKIQQTSDKLEQWEVSYETFINHYAMFDINYLIKNIKHNDEDENIFKEKINTLTSSYTNKSKKTLSLIESFKNDKLLSNLILLNSLHILINKYSKIGCGVIGFNSSTLSSVASINTGTSSSRLPMGHFIEYKQHRLKTESIWNIPENTLNGIFAQDEKALFENIKNGTTKFIWCIGINKHELQNGDFITKDERDNPFVVSSLSYLCEIEDYVDLVLPTATIFEKEALFENGQRELVALKQQIMPFGESMSELWQILEFSKRVLLEDVWGEIKTSQTNKLPSVLDGLKKLMIDGGTSLYNVLFETKFSQNNILDDRNLQNINFFNTEVFGDARKTKSGNNLPFYGCNFYIQKYLFNELRTFGISQGYDLESFEYYQNNHSKIKQWPILLNKGTTYRFNPKDDYYALKATQKGLEYLFYGKMGGKQLPFGDDKKITDSVQTELKFRAKIFMAKDLND